MAKIAVPPGHAPHDVRRQASSAIRSSSESGGAFERRLAVGRGPVGEVACSAAAGDGSFAVANFADDSVSLFDVAGLELMGTVAVEGEPMAVVVADDRAYVSVTSATHDAVMVIDVDARGVIANYPLASGVSALAVSPDGKRVYAGRAVNDRVELSVIDTAAERVGTIDIGSGPAASVDAIRVDPRAKRLYVAVTDDRGSQVVIVDAETTRVARVIPVGPPIRDIAYGGDAVYVLTSDRAVGGAIYVVDLGTHRVSDFVALGGAPTQLSLSPDEARAYVVDYDRVVVVCALSLDVIDSLQTEARPSCVAQRADGSRLFVADYSGAVNVFAVESTLQDLYSELLATDPIALSLPSAREPVTA
ncbi:YncE family protein [Mycobacterium sp. SMC-4]|uniref:YncE family protein n=1 Tax=Mycobacterium sp. SMC-4 TaxID=2857059 RepID=UPI0021B418FF|nr:YncE family protein [Mycobacterium sp. SMC-4]